MRVVVNPISSINVRVNTQNPQVNHGTTTFIGAGSEQAQIQQAMNMANTALIIANSALSLANTKYSANGGLLSGDMQITGNVTPTIANNYTLGSSIDPFQNIYVGNLVSTGNVSGTLDGGVF